ncbi:Autophagy-related protein 11 [Neolecta irregularis DAH-3]|uniref:Autophagy-related protein 11 n=1 Tax=Neolecta irregularis (strain DAH-3) TaxID=1198029 RepID=A0A1U7LHK6_NEOID|nr:Autophagy-related protein 11 [Neolecta irregularis DAH-3]|eukprot:OLL22129.1 Autophagy-related protein 11 [Neolecta irregularis DAH-3]
MLDLCGGKNESLRGTFGEDLFVFNRELLADNAESSLHDSFEPIEKAPELPFGNENSISAFQARVQWAKEVAQYAVDMRYTINEEKTAIGVIQQSVAVAIANLNTQTKTVLQNVTAWEQNAMKDLQEQDCLLTDFDSRLENLGKIQIKSGILDVTNLSDLIDMELVQSAKNRYFESNEAFRSDVLKASSVFADIGKNTEDLKKKVALWTKNTSLESLDRVSWVIEDIVRTAAQVDREFRDLYVQSSRPQSQERKLKYHQSHTDEHIPTLSTWSSTLYLKFENIMKMKVWQHLMPAQLTLQLSLSRNALLHLQDLSQIQIQMIHLRNTISGLVQFSLEDQNDRMLLEEVNSIPEAYGSLLIEYYRRTIWGEWILKRATKISEDLKDLNDVEESRRQKWVQQFIEINSRIKAEVEKTAEITFNVQSGTVVRVTREEVMSYIELLQSFGFDNEMLLRLNDAVRTAERISLANSTADFLNGGLNAKAFKSNRISTRRIVSLTDPPDMNQLAIINREKEALEEQCKNHLSRIRNLEEMLFKQNQQNPTLDANVHNYSSPTTPISPQSDNTGPSPRIVRRDRESVSKNAIDEISRQAEEIESLKAKIKALTSENVESSPMAIPLSPQYKQELEKYTEEISSLKVELELKATSEKILNSRLLETDEVKNDLLKNLEAQQADFVSERKDLRAQIDELVHRIEELEDEDKIEELEDLICQLRGDNEDLHMRMGELEEELDTWRKDREVASRLHQDQLEVGSRAINELRKAIKMSEDVVAAEANWNEEQLDLLRYRYGKLEENFLATTIDKDNALQKFEELQVKMKEELANRDEQYGMLVAEHDTQKAQNLQVLSMLESSKRDVDQEYARRKDLEMELEKLVANIRGLSAPKDLTDELSLSFILDSVEKQYDQLQQETESLKSEKSTLNEKFDMQLKKTYDYEQKINTLQSRLYSRTIRAQNLTQRLYTFYARASELLVALGFDAHRQNGIMSPVNDDKVQFTPDNTVLYWTNAPDSEEEGEKFAQFLNTVKFDFDAFSETVKKRVLETEYMARKWQKESKGYREKANKARDEAWDKIAYRNFMKDDLALFLPTRNNNGQKPWAAFNQSSPHYFLKEEDCHRLASREFLLARISGLEESIVDSENAPNDNPCNLPDGTKWHLLEAVEEKGAGSARRRRKAALLSTSTAALEPPPTPTTPENKRKSLTGLFGRNM